MTQNIIAFEHISKAFPGVMALNDVSFDIKQGEVHALMGENGAGKSTLLNILHGVYTNYSGDVYLRGEKVKFKNAHEAIKRGVYKVHQEISLVEELSIGQNIVLGSEPCRKGFIDYKTVHNSANEILRRLHCTFKSEDRLKGLSVGEMQMIAIAKALYHNAQIISLDEPTASLSCREVTVLFDVITELKKHGITIVYVSHRLEEIFKITDRISVLRDGNYIETVQTTDLSTEQLIKSMVGRDQSLFVKRENSRPFSDEVVLKVDNLHRDGIFNHINFELRKGEILGFSGLVGSKRTDVLRAIFGIDDKDSGKIYINGKEVHINKPKNAVQHGLGLVPENRKTQGFIKDFSNAENVVITALDSLIKKVFINYKKRNERAQILIDTLNVHPNSSIQATYNLSGGNQQKIVIAKWLFADADIILLDEPTKGIDVGAKAEIYKLMEDLVHKGKSIIMVSSELSEIISISDRVLVFHEGSIVKSFTYEELSEEKILHYAMGGLIDV